MDFWRFFRGSENPSVLTRTRIFRFSEKLKKALISSQTSLLTKQTLFLFVCLSFACLLLVPTGTQYPAGSPKLKSSEFWLKNFPKIVIILMRFWRFLASSYEGAYFGVRNRVRFCQKLKRSQNYDDFATRAAAPKIPASFLSVALTTLIYGFLLPP